MTGFKNWEKREETDRRIGFQNTVTGVYTVVEKGGEGEWEAYSEHRNYALDYALDEHFGVFTNKEDARDAAKDYRAENSFEQYETRHNTSASALNSMVKSETIQRDPIEKEVYDDHVMITVNTKDYLETYLQVTEETRMFQNMLNLIQDVEDISGYKAIQKMTGENVGYTYGEEVAVHPDFQYCMFDMADDGEPLDPDEIYDKTYVAVQIHTGTGDARVGFSKFYVFELAEHRTTGEFMSAMSSIYASAGDKGWYTDDTYNWYADGAGRDFDYDSMDEVWEFDPENNKVYDKETGEEVTFSSSALMG